MSLVTDINALDLNRRYSYADYLKWRLDEYVELLRGQVWRMSPAPSIAHQKISARLSGLFFQLFDAHSCEYFHAPTDVRLFPKPSDTDVYTVVQPDLFVVCDLDKLDEKGCQGAPDLVVEILSPSTSKKDAQEKFELYQEAGVREYWMVHPTERYLQIYVLEQNQFRRHQAFGDTDVLSPVIFPDLRIDLGKVFP